MENGTTEFVELLSFNKDCEEIESQSTTSDVDSESELKPSKLLGTINKKNNAGQNVMKKEINVFSGVAYVVGGIIGSGIFVTPRRILTLTHSFGLSIVIWIFGGIIALLGGLCYIELGLLIRKSGGEYSYIKEAYSFKKKHWLFEILGSLLAFTYLWSSIFVIRSSGIAVLTLTSARYLISPFYIDCDEFPEKTVVFLALAILGKFC